MIDALYELFDSITRHRLRALATAFGVCWGWIEVGGVLRRVRAEVAERSERCAITSVRRRGQQHDIGRAGSRDR